MAQGDHCSVWGCDNNCRYLQKVRHYKCQQKKRIPIWKRIIGRTDAAFRYLKEALVFTQTILNMAGPNPVLFLEEYTVNSGFLTEKEERRVLEKKILSGVDTSQKDCYKCNWPVTAEIKVTTSLKWKSKRHWNRDWSQKYHEQNGTAWGFEQL